MGIVYQFFSFVKHKKDLTFYFFRVTLSMYSVDVNFLKSINTYIYCLTIMKLQRLKRILSEDKKWLSSYVNKASDKNLKDTLNMMRKSKDMSDDEFSRENARINRRNARIQKALPKVK
jgi:hypothetical protein